MKNKTVRLISIFFGILLFASLAMALDMPPCYAEIIQNNFVPVTPACIAMSATPGWIAALVAWYQQWAWLIQYLL